MYKARQRFLLFTLLSLVLVISTNAWAVKPDPVCGDGKCRGDETVVTCPEDCTAESYCGDGVCDADETNMSCPTDCDVPPAVCNNDGTCNEGEDCMSCPNDCAGVTTGKPSGRYCCGDTTCDTGLCGVGCGTPGSTPYCGDGLVNQAFEECDDAGESAACDLDCTYRICGDGTWNQTSGEECDDGSESATCDADCTDAVCGDGTLNLTAGEQCDDGNTTAGDGCDGSCWVEIPPAPYCGDGNLDPGEECDDGNTTSGDGCDESCMLESSGMVPANQFNVGDSIGEGEAADGTIGEAHHETVWSTGYDAGDSVGSLNERFENRNPNDYYENDASRDPVFNHAVSGAVMDDFYTQVKEIVDAVPSLEAGMITVLLGNNDVCASTLEAMTIEKDFKDQYRAGLEKLAGSELTRYANIHVSSIPAIYWLWEAKRTNWYCRLIAWPFVPCDNLLDNPADDCVSTESRLDPDTIYSGDGDNCIRRKEFHAKIRDVYNPILRDILQVEYIDTGKLPNASYLDVFDVRFEDSDINGGDCFHPSDSGHALLSEKEWCRSQWGAGDEFCTP